MDTIKQILLNCFILCLPIFIYYAKDGNLHEGIKIFLLFFIPITCICMIPTILEMMPDGVFECICIIIFFAVCFSLEGK